MSLADASSGIRLSLAPVDYLILILYFVVVVLIGISTSRRQKSSQDFLLAGRSMPAWISGIAFMAANLGATEVLGMAANGAQIGISTLHYYLIGAIPAMVFLGIVMMPFYYGSGVRSVPEFMYKRFGKGAHLLVSLCFAISTILVSGINLYAMSLILEAMLGWSQWIAIIVSAVFVLVYISLGGLTSAIYNEVMQFFVIVAALIPLTIVGLHRVGGWNGLQHSLAKAGSNPLMLSAWQGTGIGHVTNPIGADWFGIVMGLGFVLGFGYWTTNFTEVQRAFSAKDMSAARRTPIIAAFPKMLIAFIVIIPGLVAAAVVGNQFANGSLTYNEAIPKLMQMYLPNGVLGVAVTGLMASFMAGMAANVSSFNTVFTYDILQDYIRPGKSDKYYLKAGRWVTVAGTLISVGTAVLAAQFGNIMTYMQTLFSFFNAPLFAVFLLGLLWKKISPAGGTWGYVAGILAPLGVYIWYLESVKTGHPIFETGTAETMYGAIISFVAAVVVAIAVSAFTKKKSDAELEGLTFATGGMKWFSTKSDVEKETAAATKAINSTAVGVKEAWWKRPLPLGCVILVLCVLLYIPFK